MAGHQPGQWTTGLCGCCEDGASCCCTLWCPCVSVGRIVNILDDGQSSCFEGGLIFCLLQQFTGLGCLYTCTYRKKLRMRFALPEDPCNDVLTDCCCLCCSVSQSYRQLKNHNLDPSKGYEAIAPPAQFMQKA